LRYYDNTGWHLTDSGQTAGSGITATCEYYLTAFGRSTNGAQWFAKQFPDFWWTTVSSGATFGAPILHPVTVPFPLDSSTGVEAYYLDNLTLAIRRVKFQDHGNITPGSWVATTNNLSADTFAGQPNGTAFYTSPGVLVFAAKADGSLWFAHDLN
jgi:hypothetical protein